MRHFLLAFGCLIAIALAARAASAAEPDPKIGRTWKAKCASCHGVDGKGVTGQGKKLDIPDFTTAAWKKKVPDEDMRKAINEGFKRPDKPEGMDAYKDKLTPEQIEGLIAYVRELK